MKIISYEVNYFSDKILDFFLPEINYRLTSVILILYINLILISSAAKFCRDPRFALESSDPIRFHCPDGFAYGASCTVSCSNGKAPQGMKSIKCNLNSDYDEPQWLSEGDVGPYCQG